MVNKFTVILANSEPAFFGLAYLEIEYIECAKNLLMFQSGRTNKIKDVPTNCVMLVRVKSG